MTNPGNYYFFICLLNTLSVFSNCSMWVMENRIHFVCYLYLPLKHFFSYQTASAYLYVLDMRINVAFYLYVCSVICLIYFTCVCLRIVLSSTYYVVFLSGFLRFVASFSGLSIYSIFHNPSHATIVFL